ncbi:MAG: hypothetical protein KatS3mg002_0236 [Candidatus Woesearchaeota archaeon]|nr:MAG: hypothetical protein KatS3mg002_0236 [Candidatus Woesearchaeota archaeon]
MGELFMLILILCVSSFYRLIIIKKINKIKEYDVDEYMMDMMEDIEEENHICTPGKISCTCPETCVIHSNKRLRCMICGRFLSKKKYLENYNNT